MFKAKLIDDAAFYSFRRKSIIFLLLPSICTGILINYYQLPFWLTIAAVLLYILIFYFNLRNARRMAAATSERSIEIADNVVVIRNRMGETNAHFNLDDVDKIQVPISFGLAQESFKDIKEELAGRPLKNFIILSKGAEQQRYDFIIDSHYMLGQFEKVIKGWTLRGYPVVPV